MLKKIVDYINGSRQELKKVVWPNKKEITQHTVMVITISLVVAFILGVLVDFSLTAILEALFI